MFERAILHLDLDAFFASVEQLKNSALRGRPLLIGGTGPRGVVVSCNYEARRFGIRSAMPLRVALQRCPDAVVIRGDMEVYSKYSHLITEIIADEAPLFEKASIDEFYVDMTGMDKHIGCWKWSKALREKIIKESGLPISLGLSVNKLVSKVGTGQAKPNGAYLVEAGTEKDFLAPLPTQKLPGIGQATCRKLSLMGVRTVRVLAQIPPPLLQREFGKTGLALWRKANALDDRPVVPFHDPKSISSEHTFQTDTVEMRQLEDRLTDLVTRLAFSLRQKQKLTACITVKIRYADFNTYTRQRKIAYTAHDQTLLAHARELFNQLFNRRQRIRLIGVRLSGLVHGNYQTNLFEDTVEQARLLAQMDRIRKRFGDQFIRKARTL
ncbi:MAG: DNA polymerase IV [Bacteroidetes bacterium]|nr:MAG: DNA polymerase IV [Bacteroidota bacterium]